MMELTREIKEIHERAFLIGGNYLHDVDRLVSMVEDEMGKQKVWDCAPEKAERAVVIFSDKSGINKLGEITYFRTLSKSRIDEIAEEAEDKYRRGAVGAGSLTDIIKSAILQARKEWESNQ